MTKKTTVPFIPLLLISIVASLAVNFDRFDIHFIKGGIHIFFSILICVGVLLVFRTTYLVRMLFAAMMAIEVLSRIAYGSSVTAGAALSVVTAPSSEAIAFISFNFFAVLLSLIVFWGLSFTAVPKISRSFSYGLLTAGLCYLILPTVLFPPEVNELVQERYRKSHGLSKAAAAIEFLY